MHAVVSAVLSGFGLGTTALETAHATTEDFSNQWKKAKSGHEDHAVKP